MRFYSRVVGENVLVETEVVNAGFALSQKWIIEKVTFLGLKNVKKSELISNSGAEMGRSSGVSGSFDVNGEFASVEFSGLSLLIGEEFKLELN